ncbi:RNA-binding protein RO60 [Denticeps clupeoides]|uniref:TROVE domain-containing protein n=1 Tax=Denticeps clupeoides TaxID=299321 RepID=A0AAY4ABI2_9TELE|nr:60 kDa SS-A/Ro ribonucleoprotein [Denticeps clupeoides]
MDTAGCNSTSGTVSVTGEQAQISVGGHMLDVAAAYRLRRFLCYGSEGATYTSKAPPLAMERALTLIQLIEEGLGCAVVEEIRRFVLEGRAVRPNSALFALALCSQQPDDKTKRAAFRAVKDVCCTPSQIFTLIQYKKELKEGMKCGMWGRALRKAVANWYNNQDPMVLAQSVTKCKHKAGWSHQDLMRLSHMKPANEAVALIIKYITKGWKEVHVAYAEKENPEEVVKVLAYLEAVEKAKHSADEAEVRHLIEEHGLEREQIQTNHLKSKEVWKALLKEMPLATLIQHLGKMTADEILTPGGSDTEAICERILNETILEKTRLHPFSVMVAMENYKRGHSNRGKLKWVPDGAVVQALDKAFYQSLTKVKPTGKRFVVGVDISASLSSIVLGSSVSAVTAAAVMCMVFTRTEADTQVLVFSEGAVVPVTLSPDMSLMQVAAELIKVPAGSTDCALPILWASENEKPVDIFIIFTNNETWFGKANPAEALRSYRQKMSVFSKLVVCGMTTTGLSIADPDDWRMLDICGFDRVAVDIIHNFVLDLI